MKSFIEEFKSFATKGNVVDLAVAVVIGAAFGKIVSSLVDNIIMPLAGIVVGGIDLTNLAIQVGRASVTYGVFLQSIVNFLIITFAIFVVIKAINRAEEFGKEKEAQKEEAPVQPSEEVQLLRQIRDAVQHH